MAKVARARAAQPGWAGAGLTARAAMLRAFRTILADEVDELAAITTDETGKPIAHARNEVRAVCDRIDWYLEHSALKSTSAAPPELD